MNWTSIWSWIEKNRFTVLCPLIGTILWIVAAGCTPVVQSPFHPERRVTALELEDEYLLWQKENEVMVTKLEMAGKDLQRQLENRARVLDLLVTLANGTVADWPGLVQLLLGSGVVGLLADNIRKNGVIGGLKRNA